MDQAARHYSQLLARHYTWMSGLSVAANAKKQGELLEALGVGHGSKRLAVDLGCGPGFQALALAELGFAQILAIDTSQELLEELDSVREHQPITTRRADLREFSAFVDPRTADLIVCMGDTLTHLEAHSDVPQLFRDAHVALAEGGKLVLTFRDLSVERTGTDRFLPIRSDDHRIMTCVLDYEPTTATVTDLIHCRDGQNWTLHKSSYQKLRLDPAEVAASLAYIGYTIECSSPAGGMHAIVARKPGYRTNEFQSCDAPPEMRHTDDETSENRAPSGSKGNRNAFVRHDTVR